jgi:predicted PurR-regulated permease PerM
MHHPTTSSTGTTRLRGGPAPDPTPVRRTIIEFPTRTLVRVVVALIIFGLAVNLLATLRDVVVWTATALFLAIALDPAVSRLERRMARPAAVLIVFGLFAVGLLVVIGALMMPLVTQLDEISKHGPGDLERLARTGPLAELDRRFDIVAQVKSHAGAAPELAFGTAGAVLNGVLAVVTVLFLTLFLLLDLPRICELALRQMRPETRERATGVGRAVHRSVGGYVAGNLLISVVAFLVTLVSLLVLSVPYAIALAMLLAVFDLIPLVGATIGSAIVILATLATTGTSEALVMLAVIVVYQQIENHLLQPLVYGRTVQLSPLVAMLAVLSGAALLGLVGALVAIPIAGAAQAIGKELLDVRAARIEAETESLRAVEVQ